MKLILTISALLTSANSISDPSARDPNMFTITGCSKAELDKVEYCFVPLYGLKNQSIGIFEKGTHLFKDNFEKVILWACDKLESGTKPCLLEMQENTESCNVYSCLLHSVRTACSGRKNLDKHWGCLFKMITNEKVTNCLGEVFAQDNVAPPSVAVPDLIRCVDEPIREDCGDETMDFLATLSVFIASPADNDGCEVNKNFLEAYTFVKSAEVDEPFTVFGEQETTTEGPIAYTQPEVTPYLRHGPQVFETKIDTNPVKVATATAETSPQVEEYCRKVLNENNGDIAFCSFKNFKETCKNVCPQ